jgi:hypothetical protein
MDRRFPLKQAGLGGVEVMHLKASLLRILLASAAVHGQTP